MCYKCDSNICQNAPACKKQCPDDGSPAKFNSKESCEEEGLNGYGCDPTVCTKPANQCIKCGDIPDGSTQTIFDTALTQCPEGIFACVDDTEEKCISACSASYMPQSPAAFDECSALCKKNCACVGGSLADCEDDCEANNLGALADCKADCKINCKEVTFFREQWTCNNKCTPPKPPSARKDPHLYLPHGARADFRGQDDTVFNFLSAKNMSFNVRIVEADFAWAKRLVHGTKMVAAYWTVRTKKGKTLNIQFDSAQRETFGVVTEEGHFPVNVREDQPALRIDDVQVELAAKTLTVTTDRWRIAAKKSPFPFPRLPLNKDKVLLDVEVEPLYDADADVVAPHGIFGQAYDGDMIAVNGKIDEDRGSETTTKAQAEGAIEGTWKDYIVESPFATKFKFSRFDLTAAPRRDISKLAGTKKRFTGGPHVGSQASAIDSVLPGEQQINAA